MSEEAVRTGGLFLPYPMLAIMMTLILALGGGIIGMYVKLDTMNATMIMRDAQSQREQQQTWQKLEQMMVYINNDRERLIRLEEQQKKRGGQN